MRTEPCSRGEMNKMTVKMTRIEAEPRKSRLCPKVPRGLAHGVGQKKAASTICRSGETVYLDISGWFSSFGNACFRAKEIAWSIRAKKKFSG